MCLKKYTKIARSFFKIENFVVFLLLFILAVNLLAAVFMFKKISRFNNQIVSLNMQFIQLNNNQTEMKTKINNMQSLIMRLQARLYRTPNKTEEENKQSN